MDEALYRRLPILFAALRPRPCPPGWFVGSHRWQLMKALIEACWKRQIVRRRLSRANRTQGDPHSGSARYNAVTDEPTIVSLCPAASINSGAAFVRRCGSHAIRPKRRCKTALFSSNVPCFQSWVCSYSNKSPGWHSNSLQMAARVLNRTPRTLPDLSKERFCSEIPMREASSLDVIFRIASMTSNRTIIATSDYFHVVLPKLCAK